MEHSCNFSVGEKVYYSKEIYGLHTILEIKDEQVLLGIPSLTKPDLTKFWANINFIFKSEEDE